MTALLYIWTNGFLCIITAPSTSLDAFTDRFCGRHDAGVTTEMEVTGPLSILKPVTQTFLSFPTSLQTSNSNRADSERNFKAGRRLQTDGKMVNKCTLFGIWAVQFI